MQTARCSFALATITLFIVAACSSSDPWIPPAEEEGAGCIQGFNGCNETGDDEAGEETGETGEEPICFVNDVDGRAGIRHQCLGELDFFIEFDLSNVSGAQNCADAQTLLDNEPLCHEYHEFGQEVYGQAVVAACCEDFGEGDPAAAIIANCAADLANQVCLTFLNRMSHHREWKHFGNGDLDEQAGHIISYLAYNITSVPPNWS